VDTCGHNKNQQGLTKIQQQNNHHHNWLVVSTCFNLFQPVSTPLVQTCPNMSKYVGQWGSSMIIPGWMDNKMPKHTHHKSAEPRH